MASDITTTDPDNSELYTSAGVSFVGASGELISDISWVQIVLAESILTPGLQTSVKIQNNSNFLPTKNFDWLKGAPININIERPCLARQGHPSTMDINQTIYRLGGRSATNANSTDNRKLINRSVEELTVHACDPTLLNDAASLVSKSWKCTTPSAITQEILSQCAGAQKLNIESAEPAKDYIAENLHPFQVITQQANAALAGGNDPSFLHFMTYEGAESGQGTHHFRSLRTMTHASPIITLHYDENFAYSNINSIMNYYFPCDFDLLSDILNGVGSDIGDLNSLALFNPSRGSFSLHGNQGQGCGIGGGVYKLSSTNQGSEKNEYSCPDFTSKYLLKRQARMGLLEKDKVAVRLTVPWAPIYNVGKMIRIELFNPEDKTQTIYKYGSGEYLIMALVHNIVAGGYSTVTLDCVSKTVGQGEV